MFTCKNLLKIVLNTGVIFSIKHVYKYEVTEINGSRIELYFVEARQMINVQISHKNPSQLDFCKNNFRRSCALVKIYFLKM